MGMVNLESPFLSACNVGGKRNCFLRHLENGLYLRKTITQNEPTSYSLNHVYTHKTIR